MADFDPGAGAMTDNSSTDLAACPFCGGEPKSYWQGDSSECGDDGYWAIECCDIHVHREGEAEAIAAWNTRHQSNPAQGWRLWGTAPEDGTVVLTYRPDAGVFTAHYVEEDAHISTALSPPEGDAYWFTTGGGDLTGDTPTHWCPLPAPPGTTVEAGNEVERENAIEAIRAERKRQIESEGWTPEHDDQHADTQLAGAAVCYTLASVAHWAAGPAIDQFWPWDKDWWKPGDKRRNLVKAGALIVAEIERLDRTALNQEGNSRG